MKIFEGNSENLVWKYFNDKKQNISGVILLEWRKPNSVEILQGIYSICASYDERPNSYYINNYLNLYCYLLNVIVFYDEL